MLIKIALKTAGKIKNHIEKPEALRTTNSLFLFNFMYVCIELSRNTVGKIIGNKLGMWRNAIFTKMLNSISFVELLLINSMRSMEIKRRHENEKTNKKEKRFSFNRYLSTNLFVTIN